MMTSTSLKTMLFVSVAMLSNAAEQNSRGLSALPPHAQQQAEMDRIRYSPHMKELIGNDPKWGITAIMLHLDPDELANIDGYDIMDTYTVRTTTHGVGLWRNQQGYIAKDFTVYAVTAKPLGPSDINGVKPKSMPGPIHFGLFFDCDEYVEYKDPADGQSGFVNSKPIPVIPVIPVSPIPTPVHFIKHPLNPNAEGYAVLEDLGEIGYLMERCSVATNPRSSSAQLRILPFRAQDESIVECKLVNCSPPGLCGGQVYQQQFIAKKYGSTTVTNGLATYTIQVGLLE